ncbi:major facilitator superfamily domain-containing protein [Exophiala viscosa]|uniref:major facilitator superfamily domain-containing protein n=1 Tax=Exophiala viscosa TaxID=2486360 RepID=UPI002194AD89|nr:major facilitator superfamily domain-containing protein [Exophiala viscosa]
MASLATIPASSEAPHIELDREDSPVVSQPAVATNRQHVLIIIASTTLVFTVCGIGFAFGVYQDVYETLSHDSSSPFYGSSPAMIDLIGTLAISLMTIGAPYATAWTKRFPPQYVIWAGGVIFSLSLLMASFCQRMWQFELTQGLLCGIGTCLAYMPAVTVAPTWFTARRGLAMGIILSGTGIGGVVWAPLLHAIITRTGFRNSLRISGAVAFVLVTAAGSVMRWEPVAQRRINAEARHPPGVVGLFKVPLVDYRIARSRKFGAQALGAALQSAAYYTPVFFFASYARTLGYSSATASNFIALSNAANAIGKIVIGHAADRVGRLNALFLTTAFSAVAALGLWVPSSFSSTQADGRNLFIAFTVLYGIFASAYVSLFPTSLIELFGVQNFASVNGVLYMVRGLATMLGTPVAGALIRSSHHGGGPAPYQSATIFVGVLLASATLAVLWVRLEATVGMLRDGGARWKL